MDMWVRKIRIAVWWEYELWRARTVACSAITFFASPPSTPMWFMPNASSLIPGPIGARRASYRLCFSASRRFHRALDIADLNLGSGTARHQPLASGSRQLRRCALWTVSLFSARRRDFQRRLDVSLLIRNVVFV